MRDLIRTTAVFLLSLAAILIAAEAHAGSLPTRVYEEGQDVVSINGYFELLPDGTWQEVNQEGSDVFRVNKQTQDYIDLISIKRGVRIRLDLARKEVFYAKNSDDAFRHLYNIPKVEFGGNEGSNAGSKGDVADTSADANTLALQVRTDDYPSQIKFFSQKYKSVWPSRDGAYDLPSDQPVSFALSCQPNDVVCYGAWENGNAQSYWGVGPLGNGHCEKCCFKCGASTSVHLK